MKFRHIFLSVVLLFLLLLPTSTFAKQILFSEDFSSQSNRFDVNAGRSDSTYQDGVLTFFSNKNTSISIQTLQDISVTNDLFVVEFNMKNIYDRVTNKLYVKSGGSTLCEITLTKSLDWGTYDVFFDFTNNVIKSYYDGELREEQEITFAKPASCKFQIAVSLNESGCAFDNWTIYNLNTNASIAVTDQTIYSVKLTSDLPLASDCINSISVSGAVIKGATQTGTNDLVVYFTSPLSDSTTYTVSISGAHDIFGRTADSSLTFNLGGDTFSMSNCTVVNNGSGYTVTPKIRNRLRVVKEMDIVIVLFDENGALVDVSTTTTSINPGNKEYAITPSFPEYESGYIKVLIFDSYDGLTLIDNSSLFNLSNI